MRRKNSHLNLCCCLLVLNLLFIWGNSMVPAAQSSEFSNAIRDLLTGFADIGLAEESGTRLLRKAAHFLEFMLLGINLFWLFLLLEQKWCHRFCMPLLFGSLSAVMDETIQIFVDGRSASIADVWIDIGGLTAGMMLLFLGYSIYDHASKRKQYHFGG